MWRSPPPAEAERAEAWRALLREAGIAGEAAVGKWILRPEQLEDLAKVIAALVRLTSDMDELRLLRGQLWAALMALRDRAAIAERAHPFFHFGERWCAFKLASSLAADSANRAAVRSMSHI